MPYGIGSYKPYCNINSIYSITSPTIVPSLDLMNADTGFSSTYLQQKHAKYLQTIKILPFGPVTALPDNTKIQATQNGSLPLH